TYSQGTVSPGANALTSCGPAFKSSDGISVGIQTWACRIAAILSSRLRCFSTFFCAPTPVKQASARARVAARLVRTVTHSRSASLVPAQQRHENQRVAASRKEAVSHAMRDQAEGSRLQMLVAARANAQHSLAR